MILNPGPVLRLLLYPGGGWQLPWRLGRPASYVYGRSALCLILFRFVAGSGCVPELHNEPYIAFSTKSQFEGTVLNHHLHQIVASPYVSTSGGPLPS